VGTITGPLHQETDPGLAPEHLDLLELQGPGFFCFLLLCLYILILRLSLLVKPITIEHLHIAHMSKSTACLHAHRDAPIWEASAMAQKALCYYASHHAQTPMSSNYPVV